MNILMLMWRDFKNPASGGAGRATHELCKRWAQNGHHVTIFTSSFGNGKDHETVDGYEIIRKGSLLTHYYYAHLYYKKYFKKKYDIVIDQINTIPYFTPFYVRDAAIIGYIHQLCREIWFYEMPFPISLLGYLLEPFYLKLYKKYPTITVSESTRQDLLSLNFSNVSLAPNAVEFEPLATIAKKKDEPTIIFVGRLTKSKRPHHLIKTIYLLKHDIPNIKLWIIGEGYFKKHLIRMAKKFKLENNVMFFGWVTPVEKIEFLKKAHCICVPSVREGWGLIVSEANAVGTPAIVYDVSGLRDAVQNGINGLLTTKNTPQAMAHTLINFFNDKKLMQNLSENSLSNSRRFNWDRSAEKFLEIFKQNIQNNPNS
jgi:glycosyltransferase involved in cell wall biosynthesis